MGHGGNVIAELTVDHHEVDELFIRIEAQPARDTRRRELVDELTVELVRHSVAEESSTSTRRCVNTSTAATLWRTRSSRTTPRRSGCSRI